MNDILTINLYNFILAIIIISAVGFGVFRVVKIEHAVNLILRRQAFILMRSIDQYTGDLTDEDVKNLELKKQDWPNFIIDD